MADHRALAAIRRIESALARIDSAAARAAIAAPADPEELDRLRASHHRLRQRVTGAIGQIDQILGQQG